MTQQTYDANQILMGGGGSPAWKFEDPGTTREGTVAAKPQPKQEREYDPKSPGAGALKFYPSGDPIMGITVEVQTAERNPMNSEDDGKRTFYIEGKHLKEAVRNGVRNGGANGLEVGGQLRVTFTHREDPMDRRSRKYWDVTYTPAGNAILMGDASQAPAQQPQQGWQAPPQAAPPAFAQPPYVTPPVAPAAAPAPAPAAAPDTDQAAAFAAYQAYMASQQAQPQNA